MKVTVYKNEFHSEVILDHDVLIILTVDPYQLSGNNVCETKYGSIIFRELQLLTKQLFTFQAFSDYGTSSNIIIISIREFYLEVTFTPDFVSDI